MKNKIKPFLIGGVVLFAIAAIVVYVQFFAGVVQMAAKENYVTIPTGSNFDDVKKILKPYLKSESGFNQMASLRKYDQNVKPGRFLLQNGMGSFALVQSLRKNVPVKIAFNNQERLEDLCLRLSSQLEPDTTKFLNTFRDSIFLKENNFNKETVFAMFIPNSYEFYWNVTAEKFRDKMIAEYRKFWNESRIKKAEKLGLSPVEVITLASIVQKETVKADERPIVAKTYLNRLEVGMPLQADPTVIYAKKLRDNDFTQIIKRVLYDDLLLISSYNTYRNIGLPPGPIAMPDVSAIDAVLNPDDNDYIYFCASVERFGYHEFASTYSQHQVNAKKYSAWLNNQGTLR